MSDYTVVFSTDEDMDLLIGRKAVINGKEVKVDILSFRNEINGVDEMKELLEEIYDELSGNTNGLDKKIEELLVRVGYWAEE